MKRYSLTEIAFIERLLRTGAEGFERFTPFGRLLFAGRIMRVNVSRPRPEAQCIWDRNRRRVARS